MKKTIFSLYFLFLLAFTFFSYLFIDPNLIYLKNLYTGFAFSNRLAVSLIYSFAVLIFFCFYFIFLRFFHKKIFTRKDFKIILTMTVVGLAFSYPAILSYDIFNYIATSKVVFFYHENPYLLMPIQFINDPLLLFTHAANKTALYGPFWILLTSAPFLAGLGNFVLKLFLFKILNVIFYLLTIFLIYRISKNIVNATIFAFNPLVIIETIVSNHNDIVMMCFALFAVFLLQKYKYLTAFLFLLLSIFIKFSTIFLIPVFIYILYNKIKQNSLTMEKIYLLLTISMGIVFLLSPLREEMYPWYGLWFLTFSCLLRNKLILVITSTLSLGLLFRYLPYMYLGTYSSPTPLLRILLTAVPVAIGIIYYWYKFKKA